MRNRIKINAALGIFLIMAGSYGCIGQERGSDGFAKTVLTRDFISEGVAAADLNNDGQVDIIAGYRWFEAPTWKSHEVAPGRTYDPWKEYSESFLNTTLDVNLDGWEDIVIIRYPGEPGVWYENPAGKSADWKEHPISTETGISNESPAFVDVDGDGRLDILCGDLNKRQLVWLQAPLTQGQTEWKRFALSGENVAGTEQYSHGLGYGDINGDNINDVVVREGWYEGKADKKSGDWVFHAANLGEPCSHMQILDINADGRNDVLSASAHELGIWWHEQGGNQQFETHIISNTTAQTHATAMADLNGDGRKDFITGKRYLAHNGNDAGDADTPYLLWMEIRPGPEPEFMEHIIDDGSGAGLNIVVADVNNDGDPDVVVANKNGVFLFENRLRD